MTSPQAEVFDEIDKARPYYGPHLTFDGYDCDPDILSNRLIVERFLNELPAEIGMTKLKDADVLVHLDSKDPEWGVTGVVIIAESHVSIHTYPAKGVVFADVFSCKPFDHEYVERRIREVFQVRDADVHCVRRGLKFKH